jgi:hypothetical protein
MLMPLHALLLLLPHTMLLQDVCRVAAQSMQPSTSCSIQSSTAEKACASCTVLLSGLLPGANRALLKSPAAPSAPKGPDTLLLRLAPLILLALLNAVPLASPASAALLPAAAAGTAELLPKAADAALVPFGVDAAADAACAIHAVCCRQKQMASAEKLRSRAKGWGSRRGSATQMLLMTACRSFCKQQGCKQQGYLQKQGAAQGRSNNGSSKDS